MRKQKKHFNAFTLVELIIVISILAILAMIAFISFQNYMKDARDGNRVASITQIDKWFNLIQIKTGSYPLPDGNVLTGALDLWWNEVVYSHMWIIDENISRLIKMNTTPLDPVSKSKYVYAVNDKKDTYQIATILENLEANKNIPIISQTYANENYTAKVIGNHEVNVKVPKDDKIWFITVPSMIFAGSGNILNSSGTYQVVNGWQNLPYKTNEKVITTKQTGNEVMKHIRKSQDAKIITVDVTKIVNATDITTRKQKIEEIFWTWGTQTTSYLWWISSKEAFVSIWAITGTNEIPDTQILTQTVESIITGGSVSSASTYTPPKTSAECWTAAKTYAHNATEEFEWTFCSVWDLEWEKPSSLPEQWESINWICISPDGWSPAECSAIRANPNEEIKQCSGKPANSKYYNGQDSHEVTVNFWSPAPTPNYADTPTENSCDYTCVDWYTHETWECKDKTPPSIINITTSSSGCNNVRFTINEANDSWVWLHVTSYSFDGWLTWESSNIKDYTGSSYTIDANLIQVRDNELNIYTYPSSINGTSSSCNNITCSYHATSYRWNNYLSYTFYCPQNCTGTVRGTNTYTDDSSICVAAMHSKGINWGNVTIEIRPWISTYTSSTRNGITSSYYWDWYWSYIIK